MPYFLNYMYVKKSAGGPPFLRSWAVRPVGLRGWFWELEGHQFTLTPVSRPMLLWLLFNFRPSLVFIPKLRNYSLVLRGFKNGFVYSFFI
jgi:hypothetical protein